MWPNLMKEVTLSLIFFKKVENDLNTDNQGQTAYRSSNLIMNYQVSIHTNQICCFQQLFWVWRELYGATFTKRVQCLF